MQEYGRHLLMHSFCCGKSKAAMFWLHKAAIIRPHLSENAKRKLYNPSHTFDYKMYV
jgi:hypothetical protein